MMTRMLDPTGRTADRLAIGMAGAAVAIGIAGAVLTLVAWADLEAQDSFPTLGSAAAGIVYALLGLLIVRRARNLVGWIFEGIGLGLAALTFTSAYAVVGALTHPGPLPAPKLVGAPSQTIFTATAIALAYLLFVFPTGTLSSARMRWIVRVGLIAAAVAVIGSLIVPPREALPAPGGVSFLYPNPLRIRSGVLSTLFVISIWVVAIAVVAAFISLVFRYRRGGSEQRQQIKWLAFVAGVVLLLQAAGLAAIVGCSCGSSSSVATGLLTSGAFIIFFGVPAAIAVAILKYGLYQIDVIINRAVVYGLLAAAVTGLYVAVVVGFGSLIGYGVGDPLLTTVAAVAIALLFQPLRRRAQRLANRLVYGDRATPYQVLSEFADRMAGTFALDDVLQRMASTLAAGTGARRVEVWLRRGKELGSVAVWPPEADPAAPVALEAEDRLPELASATRVAPVRHGEELLGALAIEKPPSEPLTPTEDELLQDLAAQAGLVLRNVRLTADLQASLEDLRASRRRLVEAQDQERRKIERNLHDGAQQQLVALTVQLGLLERAADDPTRVREMAERIRGALQGSLDDLRDLARGIYPPLLADEGLAVAIEAQARKSAVPTTVEVDGIGRYPQDIEAAVYFCTLEALQNVAKYAKASTARVQLAQRDGTLDLEIRDDGRGFDVDHVRRGMGLQGMADRLDAIGGTLTMQSRPGEGTLVRGSVPLR
jgi:signal transduction histidine kinase